MRKELLLLCLVITSALFAQAPYAPKILNEKERAEVIDSWLTERLTTMLPDMMRKQGIDMWLVIASEYNEDPVIRTLLPATWLAARRTTMLVMYDPGNGKPVEKYAIARYNVGNNFEKAWNPNMQPDQWQALSRLIQEKNPKKIGINRSKIWAHADGLSSTHYEALVNALPKTFLSKLTPAERLAVNWLETRTQREMVVYQQIVRIAHQIIAEGLSDKVIQPGITTTDDVVWWMRDRIRALGLDTWFHPSVSIQRQDPESFDHLRSFSDRPEDAIIQPGDLIHTDFGITYLRLNTDTQQHAYILKPGETAPPTFLVEAFKQGNAVQDVLTSQFATGKTGNQILKDALAECEAKGLKGVIYTHPIGYNGHASGPTIGLWDQQGGVPGSGDYALNANTAYSIELNAGVFIDQWGKEIRIMLEEDGFYDGKNFRYIDGRQKELWTIPRALPPNGN